VEVLDLVEVRMLAEVRRSYPMPMVQAAPQQTTTRHQTTGDHKGPVIMRWQCAGLTAACSAGVSQMGLLTAKQCSSVNESLD
jgi:hypothetical protein